MDGVACKARLESRLLTDGQAIPGRRDMGYSEVPCKAEKRRDDSMQASHNMSIPTHR